MEFELLADSIKQINDKASSAAKSAVNLFLSLRNWAIGYYIVEYEQDGSDRAEYGSHLLKNMEKQIEQKGMNYTLFKACRQFFKVYPQIGNEQAGTKPGGNGDSNSSIESTNPGLTTPPNSNLKSSNTDDSTLNSGSESSENTGSSSSNSGGNSSTPNKPWQYEENKNRKPAFEIGFDTITNKYKVYNQTNERLSNDKLDETAFAIQIKSKNGTVGNIGSTVPIIPNKRDINPTITNIIFLILFIKLSYFLNMYSIYPFLVLYNI